MKRVSVIGLGLMGSAIARSLVRAGHTVTVWNRTSSRAEVIAAEGASVARDPAEAVAASQASIWCLLDYPIIAEVMNQPDVRDALAGKTAVPSATGGPDEVALVAEALASAGAHHVDAKIMFFPAQAGDPDAELLLSGDRAAYEANRDWLGDVGGIVAQGGCRQHDRRVFVVVEVPIGRRRTPAGASVDCNRRPHGLSVLVVVYPHAIDVGIVQRLLFDLRQEEIRPGHRLLVPSIAAGGKMLLDVVVRLDRDAELLEVVHTFRPPRRLAGSLNRRQQERHEHAYDRDHDQQLNKRKTTQSSRSAEPRRTKAWGEGG